MLDSIGGIATIGSFLFLFVVFGLYARRRATLATPSPSFTHFWDDHIPIPLLWDVQVVPTHPRPWAELLPLSAQYTPDEVDKSTTRLQINTLIVMPTLHRIESDPELPEILLGSTQIGSTPPLIRH